MGTGTVHRSQLEVLQQKKRDLQNKIEILRTSSACITEEDKEALESVLTALAEAEHILASDGKDAGSRTSSNRTGGRGGGKPKRSRADAFETTMAALGHAALKLSDGPAEETQFEKTMRQWIEHRMSTDAVPMAQPAAAAAPSLTTDEMEKQLQKFLTWRETGLLTEVAYKEAVSHLISRM